ncbi:LapB repeat-containing protein [Listeria immobilis]|uniref:LapB repeat-containing protein n=1 Tax=Listeria immobilis TaxID=2713502 RepID=UPI001628CF02|nr:LapB repeat-containing protein [Listeria immobilis]MBC1514563.1 LapB repeat-containing protein [Listeria immobilis]
MNINWKTFLLVVLLLALIVPVYTKAVETGNEVKDLSEVEGGEKVDNTQESITSTEPVEVLSEIPSIPKKTAKSSSDTEALTKIKEVPKITAKQNNVSAISNGSTISDIFPDTVMASTIVRVLNSTTLSPTQVKRNWTVNDVVTENDLRTILQFWGVGQNITSIEGIQYCTNLREISIADRVNDDNSKGVVSLEPLSKAVGGFPNLTELKLDTMQATDLSPLGQIEGGFPKLERIYIRNLPVTNAFFIKEVDGGFPKLKELTITKCKVDNYPSFSQIEGGFPSLEILNLGENKSIDNLDFLIHSGGFPKLEELSLFYNQIDSTALESLANIPGGFPKLEKISVTGNKIDDLTPLTRVDWPLLKYIYIDRNNVADISELKNIQSKYRIYIDVREQSIFPPKISLDIRGGSGISVKSADFKDLYGVNIQPTTFKPENGLYQTTDSMITWEWPGSAPDPYYYKDFVRYKGVTYSWDKIYYPTAEINIEQVMYSGTVYQQADFMHFPPTILADGMIEYGEREQITEKQFLQDIHATTGEEDEGVLVDSNFEKVVNTYNLGTEYLVTLTAYNLYGSATPVTVRVRIEPAFDMHYPATFRMDIDNNPDAVPISDKKQILHAYGTPIDPKVNIVDRRAAEGSWILSSAVSVFENSTGDILETTLKYHSDTLSSDILLNSTNQPIEKKGPAGTPGTDWTDISLQDCLSMEILPNDALAGREYTATINWTLEDVPHL